MTHGSEGTAVRRREVGCQWESPEEEWREVGCQSDSAERRDAAVQVDLLTQQLSWSRGAGVCGVAWHRVSVRADEPGGGALLQHCRTNRTHTADAGQQPPPLHLPRSPLTQTQLPTMPLFRPPALPASLQPELQQTSSLPSMPLCKPQPLLPPADVSAPPGLIAPLSPRLAEEEEEDEVKPVKTGETEQAWRPRRKTVGPPIRYLLESEKQSNSPSAVNHNKAREGKKKLEKLRREHQEEEEEEEEGLFKHKNNESFTLTAQKKRGKSQQSEVKQTNTITLSSTACPKRKLDNNERCKPAFHQVVSRSEEKSSIQKVKSTMLVGQTQRLCRKKGIQTKQPAARIQHTQASGGENKVMVRRKKEEEEEQLPEEDRRCKRRRRMREEEEDGVKFVKPEEMEQDGRRRGKTGSPPMRYLRKPEDQSHGPSAANQSKTCGAMMEEERRGGVGLTEGTDSSTVETSEDRRVSKRWKHCQVCDLTFTCQSSLQRHLSVHRAARRLSCHLCYKNFSHSPYLHLQQHHRGNPGSSSPLTSDNLQDEEDNSNTKGERKQREEGSKEEEEEEEEKACLPFSTKAPDWSRCTKRVHRNPQWWVDYQTPMKKRQYVERWRRQQEKDGERGTNRKWLKEEREEEEKPLFLREEGGAEEGEKEGEIKGDREVKKEEKVEQESWPQRPRRKMVGPPIRYLLESEEQFYGPVIANERERAFKQSATPQRKSNSGGGASDDAAIIDRPEDTKQTNKQTVTETQMGGTKQVRVNRPQGRGGRPNKVVLYCEAGVGASKMIDRSDTVERQVGQMVTEQQMGHLITERRKTLLPASNKSPDWSRRTKRMCRNLRGQVNYRTIMKRRQGIQRWRRWQEKDEEKRGNRESLHEKEQEVKPVFLRKEEGDMEGKEEEKEEEERHTEVARMMVEQPQRLRRKMVGPPIRYLLESEELTHGAITANEDRARAVKQNTTPQKKNSSGGGASNDIAVIDRPEDTELTDRQTGQTVTEKQTGGTKQDRVDRPKGRQEGPNTGELYSETGGGASAMINRSDTAEKQVGCLISDRQKTLPIASTKAPDWMRIRKYVHKNPRWWVDYRTRRQDRDRRRRLQERNEERRRHRKRCRGEGEKEAQVKQVCLKEEGGGEKGGKRIGVGGEEKERQMEVKKEMVEQPQRPRRTMVGPPIRYLLGSEELSHGAVTAYEFRAWAAKQHRKPEKRSKAVDGASDDTAMIDRPEVTEQTSRQAGMTEPDGVKGANGSGGRSNEVVIDRSNEVVIDRSDSADGQTGQTVTQRQTGLKRQIHLAHIDLQSREVTVISPCCVILQRLPLIG